MDRRKACYRKSKFSKDAIDYLTIKIKEHWSPEQISNRSTSVIHQIPSASTIYRLIHAKKLTKTSMKNLRRKGKFKRPKEIYKRQEQGHWEADTVESGRLDHKRKSRYCFVTLAEKNLDII